jgi:hypothetical protein
MKVGWIVIGWIVAGLAATAVLEAIDALGFYPGLGWGSDTYFFVTLPFSTFVTMLLGGAVLMAASLGARPSAALAVTILPLVPLLAGAVAALDLVRFWGYDLPSEVRVMEASQISPAWFAVFAVLSLAVALVAWVRPRLGLLATGAYLWFCFGAMFYFGPWA